MPKFTHKQLTDLAVTVRDSVLFWVAVADQDEYLAGLNWYAEAHELMRDTAEHESLVVDQVAGAFAAMSPRVQYNRNIQMLFELLGQGHTEGLSDGVNKAKRILAGESPRSVLRGRKVRAFYDNIMRPWHSSAVTFDTIMCQIAGFSYPSRWRKGEYEACTLGVHLAAARLRIMPHQAQAIAWVTYRNRNFARFEALPDPV